MTVLAVITAIAIGWLVIRGFNSQARPHHKLGVTGGQLAQCPESPNCVSTTSSLPEQRMPTIPLVGSSAEAMTDLVTILRAMPRCQIITADEHYLHAEFSSRAFGFIDDIEFLVDEENHVIHFRAGARIGYSDLGVNRKRMTQIREQLEHRHSNDN